MPEATPRFECRQPDIEVTAGVDTLGRLSELAKNWHNPMFFRGIRLAGGLFALLIGVYWMLIN